MNFLAHFYLSGKDENIIVGNFLADFLTNREVRQLPELVKQGVVLHRKIDTFTDNHPVVQESVKRLRPLHHKYAPVILDVLFDYVLAKNWGLYSTVSLATFTKGIYATLEKHFDSMPEFVQLRMPLMIKDDWLMHYGTENGLRFTFARMKLRTQHPRFFDYAVESFKKDYSFFEANFNAFFPDAIKYVQSLHISNP